MTVGETRPPVLVTGGAGYIGSHAVLALRDSGYRIVVVDDLSNGWRDAVPDDVEFILGDVADGPLVARAIREHRVRDVIHFAGSIQVGESVADPLKYYRNNTSASRTLIETCVGAGVERFLFSSTAAVYASGAGDPLDEDAAIGPESPYGWSKAMTERILADVAATGALCVGVLRYFNVAGADPRGRAGQRSRQATHLIKVACEAAVGKRPAVEIFGTDYPTPDGTCLRDYVHVSDLAEAHVRVLEWLPSGGAFEVMNCGYGRGHSVREVLRCVGEAAGRPLDVREGRRRAGDAVVLVANPTRLAQRTGWRPMHDSLDLIVETALAWERRLAGNA
jgi:UDP-glucose 4-epimerase